ncbi:MAG TPA: Holliday junction branch migration protein RuvA [Candidatus Brocadiia bacterium]|nr:Holliday junction branch migration protein RuvA [Candidatus Brocadiia bacterium]
MFDFLRGKLVKREMPAVALDVNGVGYELTVPLSSFEKLPASGEVTLLTHVQVSEDAIRLYGFMTKQERDMFRLLLGVNRIGPALAVGMLSGCSAALLRKYIVTEDVSALQQVKGVGKKTAQRLILELKPALEGEITDSESGGDEGVRQIAVDVVMALISLQDTREQAERAVRAALKELPNPSSAAELTRVALRHRT